MNDTPILVDSHCHLDYLLRDGLNLDEVIANANRAGVQKILTISTAIQTFDVVWAIAQQYDCVYATAGVHPHDADDEMVDYETLLQCATRPKVIGIGETGLDFYYNHSKRNNQIDNFITHIRVAQTTQKPIIIHTRNADEETIHIIKTQYAKQPFKGLIHCFSSNQTMVEQLNPLGFYYSLSGIITFKSASEICAAVPFMPNNKILVETDSPFLAPIPYRGQKNQPAFVVKTAQKLAELKNVTLQQIAQVTTDNFNRLFQQ